MNVERYRELSAAEAMNEIILMEQQAQVMGAQDYEPSAFEDIKQKLLKGTTTPREALLQARQILESKQDYH